MPVGYMFGSGGGIAMLSTINGMFRSTRKPCTILTGTRTIKENEKSIFLIQGNNKKLKYHRVISILLESLDRELSSIYCSTIADQYF